MSSSASIPFVPFRMHAGGIKLHDALETAEDVPERPLPQDPRGQRRGSREPTAQPERKAPLEPIPFGNDAIKNLMKQLDSQVDIVREARRPEPHVSFMGLAADCTPPQPPLHQPSAPQLTAAANA